MMWEVSGFSAAEVMLRRHVGQLYWRPALTPPDAATRLLHTNWKVAAAKTGDTTTELVSKSGRKQRSRLIEYIIMLMSLAHC